jgi:hypothetical protein
LGVRSCSTKRQCNRQYRIIMAVHMVCMLGADSGVPSDPAQSAQAGTPARHAWGCAPAVQNGGIKSSTIQYGDTYSIHAGQSARAGTPALHAWGCAPAVHMGRRQSTPHRPHDEQRHAVIDIAWQYWNTMHVVQQRYMQRIFTPARPGTGSRCASCRSTGQRSSQQVLAVTDCRSNVVRPLVAGCSGQLHPAVGVDSGCQPHTRSSCQAQRPRHMLHM